MRHNRLPAGVKAPPGIAMSSEASRPLPIPQPPRARATERAPALLPSLLPALSPGWTRALALCLIAVVAILDYVIAFEIRLAILYVMPVAMVTWVCGRKWGYAYALVATAAWAADDRHRARLHAPGLFLLGRRRARRDAAPVRRAPEPAAQRARAFGRALRARARRHRRRRLRRRRSRRGALREPAPRPPFGRRHRAGPRRAHRRALRPLRRAARRRSPRRPHGRTARCWPTAATAAATPCRRATSRGSTAAAPISS